MYCLKKLIFFGIILGAAPTTNYAIILHQHKHAINSIRDFMEDLEFLAGIDESAAQYVKTALVKLFHHVEWYAQQHEWIHKEGRFERLHDIYGFDYDNVHGDGPFFGTFGFVQRDMYKMAFMTRLVYKAKDKECVRCISMLGARLSEEKHIACKVKLAFEILSKYEEKCNKEPIVLVVAGSWCLALLMNVTSLRNKSFD